MYIHVEFFVQNSYCYEGQSHIVYLQFNIRILRFRCIQRERERESTKKILNNTQF